MIRSLFSMLFIGLVLILESLLLWWILKGPHDWFDRQRTSLKAYFAKRRAHYVFVPEDFHFKKIWDPRYLSGVKYVHRHYPNLSILPFDELYEGGPNAYIVKVQSSADIRICDVNTIVIKFRDNEHANDFFFDLCTMLSDGCPADRFFILSELYA